MKIAIIADALDNQYAGIHVYTRELLLAMDRIRGSHQIIAVREKDGPLPNSIRQIIIPPIGGRLGEAIRLGLQVPRMLKRLGVDAVIEPRHVGPFNLPRSIRRATVIHDLGWISVPEFHPWSASLLQRLIVPRVLKRSDLVIANSQWTAQDISRQFPFCTDKTIAAPLGRPPGFRPKSNSAILQKYGIKPPYFLFVSTLEPRKNLGTLLEAFTGFRQKKPEATQLVLVGKKGWKTAHFDRAMAVHPYRSDILRPGFVPDEDLPFLYSSALALVYPSWYEGFGLPILEAFCCGTPVIASNRTSIPDVAGHAAILLNPQRPDLFAEAMYSLATSPHTQDELRNKGLLRAAQFDWEQTARIVLDALVAL